MQELAELKQQLGGAMLEQRQLGQDLNVVRETMDEKAESKTQRSLEEAIPPVQPRAQRPGGDPGE